MLPEIWSFPEVRPNGVALNKCRTIPGFKLHTVIDAAKHDACTLYQLLTFFMYSSLHVLLLYYHKDYVIEATRGYNLTGMLWDMVLSDLNPGKKE